MKKLVHILANHGLIVSLSQGRRLVTQGAVRVNGEQIRDASAELELRPGDVIQVGKTERTVRKEHTDF